MGYIPRGRIFSAVFLGLFSANLQADIGRIVVKGTNFRPVTLKDFVEPTTKGVALIFAGTKCPLVKQYIPTLQKLHAAYAKQGIVFIAVYSEPTATVFTAATSSLLGNIPFLSVVDSEGKLADAVSAEYLSQAVVLSPDLKDILYMGAIDDQFTVAGSKINPSVNYLQDALSLTALGLEIHTPFTSASGCAIGKTRPEVPVVTYHEDVEPIIQAKCQVCHRPGQPGAAKFDSFLTYKDVSTHADTILEVVEDGRMPPSYMLMNKKFGTLHKDRRLTAEETETIANWVRGGVRRGDPAKAPPAKTWVDGEWKIGKPDVILKMEQPYQLPATGIIDYQMFKMKMNYPDERWIQAVEIKPGNAAVVHHAELHVVPADDQDYSGVAGMTKIYGISGEKAKLLAGFAPGDEDENARIYPLGQAVRLPKNTDLVFELHYTTTGQPESDQSSAGLIFAKTPPKVEICNQAMRLQREKLRIPAFQSYVPGVKEIWFRKNITLYSFRAHMHKIGRDWKLEWVTENPKDPANPIKEFFAAVPTWDFGWQRSFDLEAPIKVPAGQVIQMTGHWDNSRMNPHNDDPRVEKRWGIQTGDEMLNTRVKFSIDDNSATTHYACEEAMP
ncbi:redoxin domain-containing protein [bacterium]|nr:redoxin domain-containing protein [bacterium]